MGLELLDLSFRIEKRLRVRIAHEDWDSINCEPDWFDVRVGDICRLVEQKLGIDAAEQATPPGEQPAESNPAAVLTLDYARPDHFQPVPQEAGVIFIIVSECVAAALNVPATKIGRETRLRRDLGMS